MINFNTKTIRFILVGISGAIIYFICSYLLLSVTKLPAYLSSFIAYGCSFGFAYLGQKYWAFRSSAAHKITLLRYAILQVGCATFAATFTQLSVSYSKLSPLILSVLATVLTSGVSYIVSSCWVFSDVTEQLPQKRSDKFNFKIALISIVGLVFSITYVFLYYHMPWSINLSAGHDDMLFVKLAQSLSLGDWLGNYSQFTLMKGPGYAFFLALTHQLGLPLYFLTAVFHCFTISFFIYCLYHLSHSKIILASLYAPLLFIPLLTSNGRIIRDQIYPDQFILSFSLLIYSLFIAKTLGKRWSAALLAGLVLSWLWLTREEGVWVLPSVIMVLLFAIVRYWKDNQRNHILSSFLILSISFFTLLMAFQYENWRSYGSFIGLDIKEAKFKSALSSIQSVREGELISHVPVSSLSMQKIYEVSPHFLKLKPFFNSKQSLKWLKAGCNDYPWTCNKEYAGGWFIWALRDAVTHAGYYQSLEQAADFYGNVADEVNKACNNEKLNCHKNLLPYMPAVAQGDINRIPSSFRQLLNTLLLSEIPPQLIRPNSIILGEESLLNQLSVVSFLNSQDRFKLDGGSVTIRGHINVNPQMIKSISVEVMDSQNNIIPHAHNLDILLSSDKPPVFKLTTSCQENCYLVINQAKNEIFRIQLQHINLLVQQKESIVLEPLSFVFEEIVWDGKLTAVFGFGEELTYQVRKTLFLVLQKILPILFFLGFIAFVIVLILSIKQRCFPVLFIINFALWLAIFARLTLLFLVHISSFPALNPLYFMPLYSLVLVASIMSLCLCASLLKHFHNRLGFA